MKVSVIIPTFNAEKYLPKLLKTLSKQTLSFELVIIDSSSTDKTVEIAHKYTDHVIIIAHSEFDHGGTRTMASKMASGKILVFLTQDALPVNNKSIENIVSAFKDQNVAAAYGRQIPYSHTSFFGKHLRVFNYPKTSHTRTLNDKNKYGIKTAFLSDSFSAYRKNTLENIGWFKNGLILGEDVYVGSKLILAKHTLRYCAEAEVYHSHSYTILQEFKRYFDIGVFHDKEKWILKSFGKPEGEGAKYIKSEFNYILKHKMYLHIAEFFLRNFMKYLGYKLGKNHVYLPLFISKYISMHQHYWKT
jgi:rhamnosyltransferase